MPVLFLCLTYLFACTIQAQDTRPIQSFQLLEEIAADVDGDKRLDKIQVVEYGNEEEGLERQIRLYQDKGDTLILWQVYDSAILSSHDGGALGDPYQGIAVKDSILSITHYGGSSWYWSLIDSYIFRDGQYVLQQHTSDYGKHCVTKSHFSIDLDSGQVHYSRQAEHCEESDTEQLLYSDESESFSKQGLKVLMKNRFDTNRIIISPLHGYQMDL